MKKTGKNKRCLFCNKYFYVQKSIFKKAKFCSKKCAIDGKNGFVPKVKTCTICNAHYMTKSFSHHLLGKTCSKKCRALNNNLKNKERLKIKIRCECCLCGKDTFYHNTYVKYHKPKFLCTDCRNNKSSTERKGDGNPAWKGGITEESYRQRRSKAAKQWRMSVFKRDNWTCKHCSKTHCFLNAHHIKPWAYYPDLRFTISNGITLCVDCHKKIELENKYE